MNSFALVKYLNVDELIDVHDDSWSVTNQKDDHDANQNYAGSDILTRNTIRSDGSSEIRFLLTVSCTYYILEVIENYLIPGFLDNLGNDSKVHEQH